MLLVLSFLLFFLFFVVVAAVYLSCLVLCLFHVLLLCLIVVNFVCVLLLACFSYFVAFGGYFLVLLCGGVFFGLKTDVNRFQNMCVCSRFESLLFYVDFCFWFYSLLFFGRGGWVLVLIVGRLGVTSHHTYPPLFRAGGFCFSCFFLCLGLLFGLHEMTIFPGPSRFLCYL